MDIFDQEILNLWKLLHQQDVKYIMVGGFATNLHGFSRTTQDLDLWIKDTKENRKKFREVLKQLDIGDFEALETTDLIPGWSSILLNSGIELDIMTSLAGFPSEKFDACYEISPTAEIHAVPVKFLHINELIEAKKKSARPKDLIDVIELEKIRKEN